jgi:8-oxo-dGTP pyrophosphatase MutT (NUDIX family)
MRTRRSARLVLLDGQGRLLLFQVQDATSPDPGQAGPTRYWMTPGGGLEGEETFEQAAVRELWEETGIRDAALGPWIWTRERTLRVRNAPLRIHERYFLVRVSQATVSTENHLPHELDFIQDHRWWSLQELRHSTEQFVPDGLADLLVPILAGEVPATPISIAAP